MCEWFIPQVELDQVRGAFDDPEYRGLVSNEYRSEWAFSKSKDRHGKEI
jgi:hypothetical protein